VIYHISAFDDNESNVPLSHADAVQNLASGATLVVVSTTLTPV